MDLQNRQILINNSTIYIYSNSSNSISESYWNIGIENSHVFLYDNQDVNYHQECPETQQTERETNTHRTNHETQTNHTNNERPLGYTETAVQSETHTETSDQSDPTSRSVATEQTGPTERNVVAEQTGTMEQNVAGEQAEAARNLRSADQHTQTEETNTTRNSLSYLLGQSARFQNEIDLSGMSIWTNRNSRLNSFNTRSYSPNSSNSGLEDISGSLQLPTYRSRFYPSIYPRYVNNNIFSQDYANLMQTEPGRTFTYETFLRGDQLLGDFDISGTVSEIVSEVQRYLDSENTPSGTNVQNLHDNMTLSIIDEEKVNDPDCLCVVCLREFDSVDIIRKFNSCSHFFHANCIERWLCQHDCCPTCRTSVVSSHTSN